MTTENDPTSPEYRLRIKAEIAKDLRPTDLSIDERAMVWAHEQITHLRGELAGTKDSLEIAHQHAERLDEQATRLGNDLAEDRKSYEMLCEKIEEQLNPPDGEESGVSILMDAVERAATYIARRACSCTWDHEHQEYSDPCQRCVALGRLGDVRLER